MRATPEQITAAAAVAFAEGGWHGATLADVGSRLGLSKSAVLYHFASKELLLDEVLRPVAEETRAYAAGFSEPPADLAARMALLRGLMEIYARHHDASLALQNDRLLWRHGATGADMFRTYAVLVDLLTGPRGDEARLRSHTVLALAFRAVTTGLDMAGPVRDLDSDEGRRSLAICADVVGG